ncbi:MAG: Cthe_2314 family HEPN domain-containing protein [Chloroflexota bacterium]|nr:Cthe_2314 family HEPN domain-containing protein [Chloroflexota bacterium]
MKDNDWLEDPLVSTYREFKYKHLKDKAAQDSLWEDYHFCSRLKLDAADYYCRQLLGMAQLPYESGLPLLAHRQFKWSLDIFFFELVSAYDMVLQEINALYGLGLEPENVKWRTIKGNSKYIPNDLFDYMSKEWDSDWFRKVRDYRNTAAHRSYIWTSTSLGAFVNNTWDCNYHEVRLYRFNTEKKEIESESEELSMCAEYLKEMVKHIKKIWNHMKSKFE